MSKQTDIKIFEDKKVRTLWDAEHEKWYLLIVDVIAVLTDSPNPQVYWRVLKKRLKDEGNETVTNCNALKMPAPDGKMRLTDAAAKKLMQRNSLFRIASQTKAITAVSIMQLYEQGKLLLDEPVSDFIPAYKNMTVLKSFHENDTTYTTEPAKKAITIRDLLTHTSGLDYPGIGSAAMKAIYAKAGIIPGFGLAKKGETLLDAMNVLAKLPLVHQPGEKWTYGLNYDLLGCLIEVISGEPLNEYCRKNIFEPVGMKDTYFNVPEEKATRLATVYTEDSLHNVVL